MARNIIAPVQSYPAPIMLQLCARWAALDRGIFVLMKINRIRPTSVVLTRQAVAGAVLSALMYASAPAWAQQQPAAPVSSTAPAAAATTPVVELSAVPAPTIAARAWITVDVTSGQVLAASNPDTQIEPASLPKARAADVAGMAREDMRVALELRVPVSGRAWRTRGPRMFIEPRKPGTVAAVRRGVIVQSGNDASVALAGAVGG